MNDQDEHKVVKPSWVSNKHQLLLLILFVWVVIGAVVVWLLINHTGADKPQANQVSELTEADKLKKIQSEVYINNSIAKFREAHIQNIERSDEYMEAEVGIGQVRTSDNKVPSYLEILSYKTELLAMPDFREKEAFLVGLNVALTDGRLTNREYESIKRSYFISKEAYAKKILLSDVQLEL